MVESTKHVLVALVARPSLVSKIKAAQKYDAELVKIKERTIREELSDFHLLEDGSLWMRNQLVVPKNLKLRKEVMVEAHSSKLSIHSW